MTEEVLQKLPDISEFPTRVNLKSTKEVLKQAIIEANPSFASLNWNDFEIRDGAISLDRLWDSTDQTLDTNYTHRFELKLKDNPDRVRYYRHRTPYQFNYRPLDGTDLYRTLFGPLVNKTFKMDLKTSLPELFNSMPYGSDSFDSSFIKIEVNDNEVIYFFSFQRITEKSSHNDIPMPFIYSNVGDFNSVFWDKRNVVSKLDYFKQHIPYIRFVADAVREEDMISTPDQPTQPNITINPSNVYTVS
jgi:hypothetical protein